MSDLISRDALIAKIKPPVEGEYSTLVSLASVRKILFNFANSVPAADAVVGECEGCRWSNRTRPQKCSCCRRNPYLKDCYEEGA